jgi:Lrp/AsnC family leucine-responsive transcriptional regulator
MNLKSGLDRFDLKILAALAEDGRISWRDLAARIGLSLTPTLRRVRRLETEGYIEGYGARLAEDRLGATISVFVSVTLSAQTEEAIRRFEQEIVRAPEVMSCFLMTGGADYMLRVVAPDLAGYQSFLMNTLTRIPGVAHIQSSFALRPVIQRSAPPLG